MKQKFAILLLLTGTGVAINGCSKSGDNVTGPPPVSGVNLLINSTFELNDSSSWGGWSRSFDDTSLIGFRIDTPPGGGRFSVKIETVWGPKLFITQTIAAPTGTHHYQLSSWAKAAGVGGNYSFTFKRLDTLTVRKSVLIADTIWTFYSVLDTITSIAGDSLVVTLYGGFSERFVGQTFYDLCKLEKLD